MKKRASLAESAFAFLTTTEEGSTVSPPPETTHPSELMTGYRSGTLVQLPLDLIEANPDQPRKKVMEANIDDLARSLKEKGVLQPVLVRPVDGGRFELLAGERRYRAARLAGLDRIPALVREDADRLEIALIENIQREDLHPVDTAIACAELARRRGITHEALALLLGKKRSTVTEILSISQLPPSVLNRCRDLDLPQRTLVEIAKLTSEREMHRTLDLVGKTKLTGDEVRARRRAGGRDRAIMGVRIAVSARKLAGRLMGLEPAWLQLENADEIRRELTALKEAVDHVLAGRPRSDKIKKGKERRRKSAH